MPTCLTRVYLASQLSRCAAIAAPTDARAVSHVKPHRRVTQGRQVRTNCQAGISRARARKNLSTRFFRKVRVELREPMMQICSSNPSADNASSAPRAPLALCASHCGSRATRGLRFALRLARHSRCALRIAARARLAVCASHCGSHPPLAFRALAFRATSTGEGELQVSTQSPKTPCSASNELTPAASAPRRRCECGGPPKARPHRSPLRSDSRPSPARFPATQHRAHPTS